MKLILLSLYRMPEGGPWEEHNAPDNSIMGVNMLDGLSQAFEENNKMLTLWCVWKKDIQRGM